MLRNEVTKANMRSEHFLTSTPLLKIWSTIMTSKVLLAQLIFFTASSSGLEVCIVTVNTKPMESEQVFGQPWRFGSSPHCLFIKNHLS